MARPLTADLISPEIIGEAIDLSPVTRPLLFIIAIAAAGYLFDSFEVVAGR